MQNESIQLVDVDLEGRLAEIAEAMASLATAAKEYFVRANEYRFFVNDILKSNWAKLDLSDPENWKYVVFDMHVFAYSKIGQGQVFRADFVSGTFRPINDDDGEQTDAEDGEESDRGSIHSNGSVPILEDEIGDQDLSKFCCAEYDSSSDDSDSDFSSGSSDTYSEEDNLDEYIDEGTMQNDLAYELEERKPVKTLGPPKHSTYQKSFTNFTVKRRQTFGQIVGRKESVKRAMTNNENNGESGEKTVVARAMIMAQMSIQTGTIRIYDCKDSDIPEYQRALEGFDISDTDWVRNPGWGRRPEKELYGERYVEEFKPIIFRMFNAGAMKSANKAGPCQILEAIEEEHPGRYCFPGDHDLASCISAAFDKQKKTGQLASVEAIIDDLAKKIPRVIEQDIQRLVAEHPNESGVPIFARLNEYYKEFGGCPQGVYPFTQQTRKDIMARVNYVRRSKRLKEEVDRKRRLIG